MPTPIFWITGPPAAGKTTLCRALLARFERALHLPVDDLRSWVVSGLADSVPWTDETESQFQIAEAAASDVVRRYHSHGFVVAVDHCRNMSRLEAVIATHLSDLPVVRVCLMPTLEVNLNRSHTRSNKTFDPHMLDETIVWTNTHYREDIPDRWKVIDNSSMTVEETIEAILLISKAQGS